jgi:hypothetical protein
VQEYGAYGRHVSADGHKSGVPQGELSRNAVNQVQAGRQHDVQANQRDIQTPKRRYDSFGHQKLQDGKDDDGCE